MNQIIKQSKYAVILIVDDFYFVEKCNKYRPEFESKSWLYQRTAVERVRASLSFHTQKPKKIQVFAA